MAVAGDCGQPRHDAGALPQYIHDGGGQGDVHKDGGLGVSDS